MNLVPNCKQAHRLMIAIQDHRLSWGQHLMLRLHLFLCISCTRFSKQLILIRAAFRNWDKHL